jgi:hypothetical protein
LSASALHNRNALKQPVAVEPPHIGRQALVDEPPKVEEMMPHIGAPCREAVRDAIIDGRSGLHLESDYRGGESSPPCPKAMMKVCRSRVF